ncbi:MAG: L-rhamnose mutarotase [Tyzzerella sp.]|nr:L-rhamnose mutarotase [Tyzzerella sp.]
MKRFIMYSDLKPEKVQDYIELHANPRPELLELLKQCNIHNYSISIRGTQLFTYYEYTGVNYEADMEFMDNSPIMQEWWKYSKPCFAGHEKQEYYENLREVFYLE